MAAGGSTTAAAAGRTVQLIVHLADGARSTAIESCVSVLVDENASAVDVVRAAAAKARLVTPHGYELAEAFVTRGVPRKARILEPAQVPYRVQALWPVATPAAGLPEDIEAEYRFYLVRRDAAAAAQPAAATTGSGGGLTAQSPSSSSHDIDLPVLSAALQGAAAPGMGRHTDWNDVVVGGSRSGPEAEELFNEYLAQRWDGADCADLCRLASLDERSMLQNLRQRFGSRNVYTYVGSILVAVNPFQFFPIYNPRYLNTYINKRLGELPPHVFAIADAAYHTMVETRQNQCVVISGESGSGKTESSGFLLHKLTCLSAAAAGEGGVERREGSVEQMLLGSGPVLEAFGNARTVHNNNSSRFGKYIQVNYRKSGSLCGAVLEKYLLEKSRIVSQPKDERNYHVFYYLLCGATADALQAFSLGQPSEYNYLNQSGCYEVADIDNRAEYARLLQSMELVGFTADVQKKIFSILATVLHLGNIEFVKKHDYHHDEAVLINNTDVLKIISNLLCVKEDTLLEALTSRRTIAGGETVVVHYKRPDAVAQRDAMAKCLYGALFDWIVLQINHSLLLKQDCPEQAGTSIGVLDIFGFEDFRLNGFEQFCINYANEHLQYYFNQHIFKFEQEEYQKEGIFWQNIDFIDNTGCIDLFAKRPKGLFFLLDEEGNFPGATNDTLLEKFNQNHRGNPYYQMPTKKESSFIICHYAGKVKYYVQDFREKNNDHMRPDIVSVLKNSSLSFVKELVGCSPVAMLRWAYLRLCIKSLWAFIDAGRRFYKAGGAKIGVRRRQSVQKVGPKCSNSPRDADPPIGDDTADSAFVYYDKIERPMPRDESDSAASGADSYIYKGGSDVRARRKSSKGRQRQRNRISKGYKELATLQDARETSKSKTPTISLQFQHSLGQLLGELDKANPFFIRCIKSNESQTPNYFDDDVVLRQLRYTGMLATIKIRQSGYNCRTTFEDFARRYRVLFPRGARGDKLDIGKFLGDIDHKGNFQIGTTKVFLRETLKILLDQALDHALMACIVKLQRWMLGRLRRLHYVRMQTAAQRIQKYWRHWRQRVAAARSSSTTAPAAATAAGAVSIGGYQHEEEEEALTLNGRNHDSRPEHVADLLTAEGLETPPEQSVLSLAASAVLDRVSRGTSSGGTGGALLLPPQPLVDAVGLPSAASGIETAADVVDGGWHSRPLLVDGHGGGDESEPTLTGYRLVGRSARLSRDDSQFERDFESLVDQGGAAAAYLSRVSSFSSDRDSDGDATRTEGDDELTGSAAAADKRQPKSPQPRSPQPRSPQPRSPQLHRQPEKPLPKPKPTQQQLRPSLLLPPRTLDPEQTSPSAAAAETVPVRESPTASATVSAEEAAAAAVAVVAAAAAGDEVAAVSSAAKPDIGNEAAALCAKADGDDVVVAPLPAVAADAPASGQRDGETSSAAAAAAAAAACSAQLPCGAILVTTPSSRQLLPPHTDFDAAVARNATGTEDSEERELLDAAGRAAAANRPRRDSQVSVDSCGSTSSSSSGSSSFSENSNRADADASVGEKQDPLTRGLRPPRGLHVAGSAHASPRIVRPLRGTPEDHSKLVHHQHIGQEGVEFDRFSVYRKGIKKSHSADSIPPVVGATQPTPVSPPCPATPQPSVKVEKSPLAAKTSLPPTHRSVESLEGSAEPCGGRKASSDDNKSLLSVKSSTDEWMQQQQQRPRSPSGGSASKGPQLITKIKSKLSGTRSIRHAPEELELEDMKGHDAATRMLSEQGAAEAVPPVAPPRRSFSSRIRNHAAKEPAIPATTPSAPAAASQWNVSGTSQWQYPENWEVRSHGTLTKMNELIHHKKMQFSKGSSKQQEEPVFDLVFKEALTEFEKSLYVRLATSSDENFTPVKYRDLMDSFTEMLAKAVKSHVKQPNANDFPSILVINAFRGYLDEFHKQTGNEEKRMKKPKKKKPKTSKNNEAVVICGHRLYTMTISIKTFCEVCNKLITFFDKGLECGACKFTCHKQCASKWTSFCVAALKETEKPGGGYVFGRRLSQLISDDDRLVPPLFEKLLLAVETKGLFTEGIYRKSGLVERVRTLKKMIDTTANPEDIDFHEYQVHVIATIVKSFLRDLAEPLLTYTLYTEFVRAADIENKDEALRVLKISVDKLPKCNYCVLMRLLVHLARVAQNEPTNRMSANALAVIFSPCLLKASATGGGTLGRGTGNKRGSISAAQAVEDGLRDVPRQVRCVELLVDWMLRRLNSTFDDLEALDRDEQETKIRLTKVRASMRSGRKASRNLPLPLVKNVADGSDGSLASASSENECVAKANAVAALSSQSVNSLISPSTPGEEIDPATAEVLEQRYTKDLEELRRKRSKVTCRLAMMNTMTDDELASTDDIDTSGDSIDDISLEDSSDRYGAGCNGRGGAAAGSAAATAAPVNGSAALAVSSPLVASLPSLPAAGMRPFFGAASPNLSRQPALRRNERPSN